METLLSILIIISFIGMLIGIGLKSRIIGFLFAISFLICFSVLGEKTKDYILVDKQIIIEDMGE